jgi:GxxExxY protein
MNPAGTFLFKDECYAIIGACFQVYNHLGCGFLEPVYQESLELEFNLQRIPHLPHPSLKVSYRGIELRQTYVPDFIGYDQIVVEIKAVSELLDEHRAQILNYLHAARKQVGLLINFGHYPKLQYERLITTDDTPTNQTH